MQIGRRIYYDKTTGNIIQDTSERSGDVIETSIEQDFTTYASLVERVPETVGLIQMEYGQYMQDFIEGKLDRIDLETLELLFSYPDPDQPGELYPLQKPLTTKVAELEQKLQESDRENKNALFEIYTMLLGSEPT
ncbi:hypothetical protein [Gorillibacterium timonense]|uniref:hypothetical protein n=1 Tax=Gorillibacterium timonense TaxID=1689269 RepID=UPI00071C37D1|nr:hypothetical protein [Gorillibacterium timonense]